MPSCIASGALLVRLRPANAPRAPQTNPKPRSGLAAVLEMAQADVAGVRAARGPLWDLAAEPAPRRHDRRRHPRRIPPRKKRDSLCFFHLHPESVDSLTDPFSLRPPHRTDPPAPPKHQVDNSNEPYLYKVSGSWGCAPAPPPRHARLFRRFDFGSPTHSLDLSPITFPLAAPPTPAPALMPGAAAAAASRRTRACGRSSWRGSAGWRRPATSLTTSFSEGPP